MPAHLAYQARPHTGLVILITGLLLASVQFSTAQIKAATVNIDRLLIEYHAAKKEISSLKARRDSYLASREARLKKRNEIAQQIQTIYDKLRSKAMPRSEKAALTEQQEKLIARYKSIVKSLQQTDFMETKTTKTQIASATKKMLEELHTVIGKYAKQNGYDWVMDTSGTSNSLISPLIYARNAVDITDDILAILNKSGSVQKPE